MSVSMVHLIYIIATLVLTDLGNLVSLNCSSSLEYFNAVLGQDVIENIGFGQPTDTAKEGESEIVRIRLEPGGISETVTGQIIPLSLTQYRNYEFMTHRTLPNSVKDAIDAIEDPAEFDEVNKDFNNTVINFTLSPGQDQFEIDMLSIISSDGINEAEEQFILVLEYSSEAVLELDEDGGVLVVTILDDNPIVLVYSASSYIFPESDGVVENVIKVQKRSASPPTEVDIPLIITIMNGTAIATAGEGGDFVLQSYIQAKVIHINETEVALDPIMIIDDDFPEGNETFLLSLMKGEGTDTLNIFPSTSPATVVIHDNDEVKIGIELAVYSVMEGVLGFVEVCITVAEEQSLNHGYGSAVINISTSTGTATGHDYVSSPFPNELIIMAGQERMCSNITIIDDIFVEAREELMVILETESATFSAGVEYFRKNATIQISDNDGAVVGFAQTNYTGDEGAYVEVCAIVRSLDQMTLNMSDFEGHFAISGLGMDTNATTTLLVLTASNPRQCINVSLTSDGLIEETEAVTLILKLTDNVMGIGSVAPNVTVITIIDQDTAVLGFNQSSYMVAEETGNSTVDVCVYLMSGIIAPDVYVSYSIEFDVTNVTQEIILDTDNGIITADDFTVCHHVTVVDNDIAEPDGEVVLTINQSSLNPPTTVISTSEATVNILNDDGLVVILEALSTTVTEGGPVTFYVTYTGFLHLESTLYVTVSAPSGSATDNADYVLGNNMTSQLLIELSDSNRAMNFTVHTIDDITLEDYEEWFGIIISLENPSVLAIINGDQSSFNITILDNEDLIFSFKEGHYEISEDFEEIHMIGLEIQNFAAVEIPTHAFITVSVELENNTTNATQDLDFSMSQQDVVFYSNSAESVLNFSIQSDLLVEGNEVTNIYISNIVINNLNNEKAARIGTNGSTVLIIIDEDEAIIGFLNTSTSTPEEAIVLCVSLLNGTLQEGLTIYYTISTTNITADGSDYVALIEIGQINSASTTYCHNITIVDDDLVEPDETVNANLLSEYNIARVLLSPNSSEITIDDDDTVYVGFEMAEYSIEEGSTQPLIIRIEREENPSPQQSFNISLELRAASTATEGEDFTMTMTEMIMFSPQEMYKEVKIMVVHDDLGEGDELIFLDLLSDVIGNDINVDSERNSTEITIIEDDDVFVSFTYNQTLMEGQILDFCVGIVSSSSRLLPNGFVELRVSVHSESATADIDYSAGFSPNVTTLNETSSETCYTIQTADDSLVEGVEYFRLAYEILDRHGHFTPSAVGSNVTVAIIDNDKFQLGFESSTYRVSEKQGTIDVYIVKMNEDILETTYTFTINASSSEWSYPANLNDDFSIEPKTVMFNANETRVRLTITAFNDAHEEGFEDFTLQLFSDEAQNRGTVNIVRDNATVSIEDDDVVVIGFEKSAYIVVEGEMLQVCVSVRNRTLTNDDPRLFQVKTMQLADFGASGGGIDYDDIGLVTKNISRKTLTRQCFTLSTTNDDIDEEPERLKITGSPLSRILQFHPDSAVIWIIDDESLVLPYPTVEDSNCTSSETQDGTLEIVCSPSEGYLVDFFCSIDCDLLERCTPVLLADESFLFKINLHDYGQENHSIEIVGFTKNVIVFRDIVKFKGQGALSETDPFDLRCLHVETEAGIIAVSCSSDNVLTSFMCSVDNNTPENCALQFEIDPESYSGGSHTFTVTATNQDGDADQYTFTFDSPEISTFEAFLMERSSIAAITVVAVTIAIFILLTLTICLLVCYHRRVSKRRHESEWKYGKNRDLCYSEANPVANDLELQEQASSGSLDVKSQTPGADDIDLPHEDYNIPMPVPKESEQNSNLQSPADFDLPPPPPQSEHFYMASFSKVPIMTEPSLTLHELSQAYGPETMTDLQLAKSANILKTDERELTVPPEDPVLHTQRSGESLIPDIQANSSPPPSSTLHDADYSIPTQHVDPAQCNLPTPSHAIVEVLPEPEEREQLLLEETTEKGVNSKLMEGQNGIIDISEKRNAKPSIKPKPQNSSARESATSLLPPTPPTDHSTSTQHMDPTKVIMLCTSTKVLAQEEDKQPLLKSHTGKQSVPLEKDERRDNKGKHAKMKRLVATDQAKISKSSEATSYKSTDQFKQSHESKLSYWREKEEMYQLEHANEDPQNVK